MSSETPPARPSRILHWFLIVGAAAMLVLTIKIVGIFFLSNEARDLQVAITGGSDWQGETEIQFSIGPGILSLGRVATLWVDDIPAEARQALTALQNVSVGIYRLDRSGDRQDRRGMLASADAKLGAKGWERIVTVSEHDDLVLIYTPVGWEETEDIEVCVAVCDGSELIVISATARMAPLIEIAQKHLPDWKTI